MYYFVDDAANNPTFYADLRKPQSLNKYQYAYNNPLRYIDPDGHDPEEPEPPQDPRPVVPLPPIPGAPPLVVPGPSTSTSTSQVPNDATIIAGAQKVLDTVADYTGITWIADKIRPFCPFCPKPTPAPAPAPASTQPTTDTPPRPAAQPLPPPAAVRRRRGRGGKQNKKDSGLRNKSDKEISKGARDRSLFQSRSAKVQEGREGPRKPKQEEER